MFKKLHQQMTLFCTLITSTIMVAMSVLSIVSYEVSLQNNEYAAFLNDIHSMIANLENQTIISHQWLVKMEKNNQYIISISNNGHALFYDELKATAKRDELINNALTISATDYDLDLYTAEHHNALTEHSEFKMTYQSQDYFVSAAIIPKNDRFLGVLMIHPLDSIRTQIIRQRILFAALNLIGIALLWVFSYFFTKRMLLPLQKNRDQQTQFFSLASHELRTPLTVILSSLSAMDKGDAREQQRFKNAIESEGRRMSRLIDDMLMVSADNTSFSMYPEPLEIDTLIIESYEKFELLAAKKHLHLTLKLPDRCLPPCLGDHSRLAQVFAILLDNAVNYTPENGTIQILLRQTKASLEVRIADSGSGIPDDQKEQIWERFYRADASHTSRRHFGLGLAIAKEIVSAHKGRIWVEDAFDNGSVFVVLLPLLE